jgi:hypothetical protein
MILGSVRTLLTRFDHLDQFFDGDSSQLCLVLVHRRERWSVVCCLWQAVKTDDGQVLGHPYALSARHLQHTQRHLIVADKHGVHLAITRQQPADGLLAAGRGPIPLLRV